MDRSKLDNPLQCTNCGAEFLVKRFRSQLPRIIDYCLLERLKQELQFLYKVTEMYREYPESRDKMVPSGFLGKNPAPTSEEIRKWTKGDKDLEEFLLTSSFNLDARKSYVEKRIEEDSSLEPMICPKCNSGIVCFKKGRLQEFEPKLT